jgi:hypothetical protein
MAAPHVAGVASLLVARDGMGVADLKARIRGSVDPLIQLSPFIPTGRLNACRALGGVCPYVGGIQ